MGEEENRDYKRNIIWTVILCLNLAVFLTTKAGLLKLTLTLRSTLQNPHDTLFFIDEMEKLIVTSISAGILVYDLMTSDGNPFLERIPNCGIRMIPLLLPNIMFFGGMATALMRCIAISYTNIISRWGEFKIMTAVLVLWHTALIGNTYLMAVNTSDEYKNRCYSTGVPLLPNIFYPMAFLFAIGTEFAIYLSICKHIYNNDIEVRQFISFESYGRRIRKNAFNLFGHTIHFLLKLLMEILEVILWIQLQIPPKVLSQFTSTVLALSMLLLSKPMKVIWTNLLVNTLSQNWAVLP